MPGGNLLGNDTPPVTDLASLLRCLDALVGVTPSDWHKCVGFGATVLTAFWEVTSEVRSDVKGLLGIGQKSPATAPAPGTPPKPSDTPA